jgi:dTDP-4-amino-4,6-dideoxygalactose transaminase
VKVPDEAPYARHVWHIYPVLVPNRDAVIAAMSERGVSCGIHYPGPLHTEDAYRSLGIGPGRFPETERCAAEELSLPMYAYLSDEQAEFTARMLRESLKKA